MVPNVQTRHAGKYTCSLSLFFCPMFERSAFLRLTEQPEVFLSSDTYHIEEPGELHILGTVSGFPPPNIHVYHEVEGVFQLISSETNSRFSLQFDAVSGAMNLTFHDVVRADQGTYLIEASNEHGEGVETFNITISQGLFQEPVTTRAPGDITLSSKEPTSATTQSGLPQSTVVVIGVVIPALVIIAIAFSTVLIFVGGYCARHKVNNVVGVDSIRNLQQSNNITETEFVNSSGVITNIPETALQTAFTNSLFTDISPGAYNEANIPTEENTIFNKSKNDDAENSLFASSKQNNSCPHAKPSHDYSGKMFPVPSSDITNPPVSAQIFTSNAMQVVPQPLCKGTIYSNTTERESHTPLSEMYTNMHRAAIEAPLQEPTCPSTYDRLAYNTTCPEASLKTTLDDTSSLVTVIRDGEHGHKNLHRFATASLYDGDLISCSEVNSDRDLSERFELTDDICTPLNSIEEDGLNFNEMH